MDLRRHTLHRHWNRGHNHHVDKRDSLTRGLDIPSTIYPFFLTFQASGYGLAPMNDPLCRATKDDHGVYVLEQRVG